MQLFKWIIKIARLLLKKEEGNLDLYEGIVKSVSGVLSVKII